jgi:hypothetical protein
MEIIGREVKNPQERQCIYDKIFNLQKSTERLLLTLRDTPPRRRSRRRATELTPAAKDLLAEIDRAVFSAPNANGQQTVGDCPKFAQSSEQIGTVPTSIDGSLSGSLP